MAWHETIRSKLQETWHLIETVLERKSYLAIFLILSILLFFILSSLTLATTTDHKIGIFVMMNGLSYTVISFFSLVLIAVLFGIYISVFVYKIRLKAKSKTAGALGFTSFIGGLFSAGCPMCGAYLFGLLGMPLALFFMPFKGLELRVLTILLLMASIYFVAKSINKCENCS